MTVRVVGFAPLLLAFAALAQSPCPTTQPQKPIIQWEGLLTRCTHDNAVPCAAGEIIQFRAVPEGGGSYAPCETFQWNFGDGSFDSFDREPTHIFTVPGQYDVTVVVSNPNGINGNATQVPTVFATLNPIIDQFAVSATVVRRGNEVTITWTTRYTYRVRIAPLGIDTTAQSGTYTFVPAETTQYTLTAEGPPSATYAYVTVTVGPPRRRAVRH
jgi:PKD domain